MKTKFRYAATLPYDLFPNDSARLFTTGGANQKMLNTVEVLTKTGWQRLSSADLPVAIMYHCMVQLSSGSVMVIGGQQNSIASGNTFVYNNQNEFWTSGPPLKTPRQRQACGRVPATAWSNRKNVIVVGGIGLTSVEILNDDLTSWRIGPSLPDKIYGASVIEDPRYKCIQELLTLT